jgi:hypothetical protein
MKYVQCQKTGNARKYKNVLGAIKPKGLNRIIYIYYIKVMCTRQCVNIHDLYS